MPKNEEYKKGYTDGSRFEIGQIGAGAVMEKIGGGLDERYERIEEIMTV